MHKVSNQIAATPHPALPLSAMSLTIERNLRQALGETDLPAPQAPIRDGQVLM